MKEILLREINKKGIEKVAYELGVSRSTVYLVVNGKYKGSTKNIEEKVKKIYGNEQIKCPILGEILPSKCAELYNLAQQVGKYVSNPEKLRLYRECVKCKIRK